MSNPLQERVTEAETIQEQATQINVRFHRWLDQDDNHPSEVYDPVTTNEVTEDIRWLLATIKSLAKEVIEATEDSQTCQAEGQAIREQADKDHTFLELLDSLLDKQRKIHGKNTDGVLLLLREMIKERLDPLYNIPF